MNGVKDVSSPSFLPSSNPAAFQQPSMPSENSSSRSTIECLQEPENEQSQPGCLALCWKSVCHFFASIFRCIFCCSESNPQISAENPAQEEQNPQLHIYSDVIEKDMESWWEGLGKPFPIVFAKALSFLKKFSEEEMDKGKPWTEYCLYMEKDVQAAILYALEANVIPFEYFGWDSRLFRWSFCLIITNSCAELKEKIATKLGIYYRPGYIDLNESEADILKIKAVLEEMLGIFRDVI